MTYDYTRIADALDVPPARLTSTAQHDVNGASAVAAIDDVISAPRRDRRRRASKGRPRRAESRTPGATGQIPPEAGTVRPTPAGRRRRCRAVTPPARSPGAPASRTTSTTPENAGTPATRTRGPRHGRRAGGRAPVPGTPPRVAARCGSRRRWR